MTVRITRPELCNAIRVSSTSAAVIDEINRLLRWATATVERHAPEAPDEMHDMAAVLLVGRAYDRPLASRGTAHSNIMRQSGAGTVLLPYRQDGSGHSAADGRASGRETHGQGRLAHGQTIIVTPTIHFSSNRVYRGLDRSGRTTQPLTQTDALQTQASVPNAELHRLDTQYIELPTWEPATPEVHRSCLRLCRFPMTGGDMPPTKV